MAKAKDRLPIVRNTASSTRRLLGCGRPGSGTTPRGLSGIVHLGTNRILRLESRQSQLSNPLHNQSTHSVDQPFLDPIHASQDWGRSIIPTIWPLLSPLQTL